MPVCPLGRPFSGTNCPKWPFFGLKMLLFLCYAYITHIFGLRQTQLNGIISSPYPQVTLDESAFSCLEGCFLTLIAQNVPFWSKNALFWSEMHHMLSYSVVLYCTVFFIALLGIYFVTFWYCMVLHCMIWYLSYLFCILLRFSLRRAGCVSQDAYSLNFYKYATKIFFPKYFNGWWPARSGIFNFQSKLSKY